jgi:DNA invertase Pin-like site-specific DNA recombinase
MISRRTKDALAAAKVRGKKLGGHRGNIHLVAKRGAEASATIQSTKAKTRAADIEPIVADIEAGGATSLRLPSIIDTSGPPGARNGRPLR